MTRLIVADGKSEEGWIPPDRTPPPPSLSHTHTYSSVRSSDRRDECYRFTVKEVKDTLDSIKLADLKPLVSRVFDRGEGLGLIQGNLQFRDVDT